MIRPDPRSPSITALIVALTALGQISTSIYLPSLPTLASTFGSGPAVLNLTLSGFLLGFAVCQMVYGPLSDHFGRRRVLLAGLVLYIAASLACALAVDVRGLILARVAQGMAACCGPVLARAVIRDVHGAEGSARAMAIVSAALAISPALAPTLGGFLDGWFGWRAPFAFLVITGVLLLVLVARWLAETHPPDQRRLTTPAALIRAWAELLRHRLYWGFTLATGFVFAGLMAYNAGAPFVFITLLGYSPQLYGATSAIPVSGFFVGSLLAARWSRRRGLMAPFVTGVVLCLTAGAAMPLLLAAWPLASALILAPMMVFGLGIGLSLPLGIAGAMAPFPSIAGAASALLGFLQMTMAAGAAALVGSLGAATARPMALVIAGTALCAALALLLVRGPAAGPSPRPKSIAENGVF